MIDLPTLRFRPNKSPARVMFGFPWIYSDDVILDRRTKKIPPGSFVKIQTNDKQDIGLIAFNSNSKITGRVMDLDVDISIDTAWIVTKLKNALMLREKLYDTPFYRLIHAEADGLPGVIIDRFGDAFVVQPNAAWADKMMPEITSALEQIFSPKIILKNSSGRARSLEGLDNENIFIKGSSQAPIVTAPGCPVAGEMPGWVQDAIEPIPGVQSVNVELIWEPQWGMDMMSDEARLELGFM